jgi:hypothetical protein
MRAVSNTCQDFCTSTRKFPCRLRHELRNGQQRDTVSRVECRRRQTVMQLLRANDPSLNNDDLPQVILPELELRRVGLRSHAPPGNWEVEHDCSASVSLRSGFEGCEQNLSVRFRRSAHTPHPNNHLSKRHGL